MDGHGAATRSAYASAPMQEEGVLRRVLAPAGSALGVLAGAVLLRVRDPHEHGSWGFCPFRAITGLDCPLCGGLRAVNDLGRAELGAAVGSNVVVVAVLLPVAAWLWSRWLSDCLRSARHVGLRIPRNGLGPLLLLLLVAFTVVRNVPFASGLAA